MFWLYKIKCMISEIRKILASFRPYPHSFPNLQKRSINILIFRSGHDWWSLKDPAETPGQGSWNTDPLDGRTEGLVKGRVEAFSDHNLELVTRSRFPAAFLGGSNYSASKFKGEVMVVLSENEMILEKFLIVSIL